jgi:hypothetical protein
MLQLLLAMLQHTACVDEAKELPILVALTVMSIVPGQKAFFDARNYASQLSFVTKMACSAVLTHGIRAGLTGSAEKFDDLCKRVLCGSNNIAMRWILDKQALGLHFSYN